METQHAAPTALFSGMDDASRFAKSLKTRAVGKRLEFVARTRSTNDLALEAARNGAPHGSVFAADEQEAGRGRRGRSWQTPPARALLFSVLLRACPLPPESMGWLPLVAGFSCAEAIGAPATIKWPNDIVVPAADAPGWRKLGGILCESTLAGGGADSYAVIGIGLNVNQTAGMFPPATKAPPTSLRLEFGAIFERREILRAILERLEANLDLLFDPASRGAMQKSIEGKMRGWMTPARRMIFYSPSADHPGAAPQHGAFDGLDAFGRILVHQNSTVTPFADAEITEVYLSRDR